MAFPAFPLSAEPAVVTQFSEDLGLRLPRQHRVSAGKHNAGISAANDRRYISVSRPLNSALRLVPQTRRSTARCKPVPIPAPVQTDTIRNTYDQMAMSFRWCDLLAQYPGSPTSRREYLAIEPL
jgi:hypothetical protein